MDTLDNKRILLIARNRFLKMSLISCLKNPSLKTMWVNNASDGINILKNRNPSHIIFVVAGISNQDLLIEEMKKYYPLSKVTLVIDDLHMKQVFLEQGYENVYEIGINGQKLCSHLHKSLFVSKEG